MTTPTLSAAADLYLAGHLEDSRDVARLRRESPQLDPVVVTLGRWLDRLNFQPWWCDAKGVG